MSGDDPQEPGPVADETEFDILLDAAMDADEAQMDPFFPTNRHTEGEIDRALWPEQITLPEQVRDKMLEAVKGLPREGARRVKRDETAGFISGIEHVVSNYLLMRGRWPRGPDWTIRPPAARDSKPHPTRTDCTAPLEKIADALKQIDQQLSLLPSESIAWVEEGADKCLAHLGIHDAYPKSAIDGIDDDELLRWRFLVRLHAFGQGVENAKALAAIYFPATKPREFDTPRLVRDVADAYAHHLGALPTSNSTSCNTPFVRVLSALFEWLSEKYKVRAPGIDALNTRAKAAIREMRRPRVK